MYKPWLKLFVGLMIAASFGQAALARAEQKVPDPIYPVEVVLEDAKRETVYPSAAGEFIVYSQRANDQFTVVRVSKHDLHAQGRSIGPEHLKEQIQYGVAIKDGAVGYISNRMGPISAWMRQSEGDGHIAIGNISTYTGALMPANLKASPDGSLWCFDSTLEATRRARVLDNFGDVYKDEELVGQHWRMYASDTWRHKQGYYAMSTGTPNKFEAPSLFLFDRNSSQLMMIPNAFNGAISPDSKKVVFVRENKGNYDLWMQGVDGKNLVQLTTSDFGDLEPAFSPDGNKIAFISNRDTKGEVLETSIYVMDLKSGKIERVTNALRATDGGPTWVDNKTILFHSNRDPKKPQASEGATWNLWQVVIK